MESDLESDLESIDILKFWKENKCHLRELTKEEAAIANPVAAEAFTRRFRISDEQRRALSNIALDLLRGLGFSLLYKAVLETSTLAHSSIDYLIANAAMLGDAKPCNAVGNVHLLFIMPLILKGNAKKVIAISSGTADIDFIAKFDIDASGPYSVSKAALNAVVAKFSAQYRARRVLFMSISPGKDDTGGTETLTEEQKMSLAKLGAKFAAYESVKQILFVIDNASVERGDGGSFVSHFGKSNGFDWRVYKGWRFGR
ncbi:hypothetical protein GQ53DRAFT_778947 [Thozetella sp. PMI_491]|nr:hypothetical protein GQ53DRAFT_778947 [Thozetella sp. PMI_491]